MISRGLGIFVGAVTLACSAAPAAAPAPAPAPAPPPPAAAEECPPEGAYGPLPGEDVDDIYDALLKRDDVDPYADESPYDAEDPKAAAKHAYEVGRKADAKERWDVAYRAFLESWSLRKHPYTAFALAKVAMSLGHHRDALRYMEFVLRSTKAKDSHRLDATEWRARALSQVAYLRVGGALAGRCVVVDGLTVGRAPLSAPIMVDSGIHHVELRRAGEAMKVDISVPAGGTVDVSPP